MDERLYRCLACETHPVYEGRVAINAHLRSEHADELERRHCDELVEQLRLPEPETRRGPFACLFCHLRGYPSEAGVKNHLKSGHDIEDGEYETHYLTTAELEYRERHAWELTAGRPEVSRFTRTLASIETVADFLVECRA